MQVICQLYAHQSMQGAEAAPLTSGSKMQFPKNLIILEFGPKNNFSLDLMFKYENHTEENDLQWICTKPEVNLIGTSHGQDEGIDLLEADKTTNDQSN